MSINWSECPVLVLNADYRPISWAPLSIISGKDAVRGLFENKYDVICEYDHELRSPSLTMKAPSVVAKKTWHDVTKPAAFNRINLLVRDNFRCAYCLKPLQKGEMTFDHVRPKCKGGPLSWENIASACMQCNGRKGNKTLKESGLKLQTELYVPTLIELNAIASKRPLPDLRKDWRSVLYWDSTLDPEADENTHGFEMLNMTQA